MDLQGARADLMKAQTEEAVIAVVQQQLQGLRDGDFDSLPDAFRPHLMRTADELSRWALYFNREDLSLPPDQAGRSLVHELRFLLTAAAWRLAEIAHEKRYGGEFPRR